jgi:PQQ-dependent dehydrogenase (methanol/ethanol family)
MRPSTLALSLALAATGAAQANPELEKLMQDPSVWASWGGDYYGSRYSPLNQINKDTAKDLKPVWTFSTGMLRGHEGGPLVLKGQWKYVDEVGAVKTVEKSLIFIHSGFPHRVYALDQDSQTVLWEYQYVPDKGVDTTQVIGVMCCDVVNRGLAYGDGKLFLSQGDGTLVALDAFSSDAALAKVQGTTIKPANRIVWKAQNGDPKLGQTNTNAPLVVKDKVVTGISGGEYGVRGFVAAYHIKDGSLAWKAYSTGPDAEMKIDPDKTMTWTDGKMAPVGKDSSLKTWQGDQWKIGGGTTWGWYSYDPVLNLVYYGSGNPSTWNPVQRPGDNKWSMTIWARDADSGEARWVYQMTPHDEWDYDGINEMMLVDAPLKDAAGKEHVKLLTHFDRNGFGYTLDRETGELLVAEKFDKAVNWASHVDMRTGRPHVVAKYSTQSGGEDKAQGAGPDGKPGTADDDLICPSAMGAKNQPPVAWSPRTKLVYIPGNHTCMTYEPFQVDYTAGQPYVGATLNIYAAGKDVKTGEKNGSADMGAFTAWDPVAGKIAWTISEPFSLWGGMVATAGDVVIYGTLEGYLKVRDAHTGAELYRFKTPSGIIGNVSTWEYQGRQYVGVLSGLGGWAGVGVALDCHDSTETLGACGTYQGLKSHTKLGGVFTVFALLKPAGQ